VRAVLSICINYPAPLQYGLAAPMQWLTRASRSPAAIGPRRKQVFSRYK
jgi:hypothetical protein